MTEQLQYSLFRDTWEQKAMDYIHTDEGGRVMNAFIRIARGCQRRGVKVGARMIFERIRWNLVTSKHQNSKGDGFKLNNNYAPYMARFAMERCKELHGYFNTRSIGQTRGRKVAVVEMKG